MLIYNVHTLQKTFAITFIERESFDSLLDRITRKSGLQSLYIQAIKSGQDGGLVYEYKGEKYSLEDDDDLAILVERFPPSSTPAVTLHLTAEVDGPQSQSKSPSQGQNHAHFAPSPPSYNSAASNVKSKAQKSSAQKDNQAPSALKNSKSKSGETNGSSPKDETKSNGNKQSNGNKESSGSVKLAPPLPPLDKVLKKIEDKKVPDDHKSDRKTSDSHKQSEEKSNGHKQSEEKSKNGGQGSKNGGQSEEKPKTGWRAQAPSIMSTRSKKSRYGGDADAEPMHVVHQRKWEEFHANRGVRTIVGEVGGVPNVRMLLEKGHKNVYVSRQFAIKNGMVDAKYGMGSKGYTGLKILGNISITVGSKTATHLAMISEEEHFDVVLGRVWLEKSGIKIDSIDQTLLTYMENGEVIPCDIVVLKDDQGNKILIT